MSEKIVQLKEDIIKKEPEEQMRSSVEEICKLYLHTGPIAANPTLDV